MGFKPDAKAFKTVKVPTSDPSFPESEIKDEVEYVALRICKVCHKALIDDINPGTVCTRCGQYAHADCSNTYKMTPHCNLCIVELSGVSKQAFKVLYGLMNGYDISRIKKAGKFSGDMMMLAQKELELAEMVEEKRFLFFKKLELTSKAQEFYPSLESIYSREKDLELFKSELDIA